MTDHRALQRTLFRMQADAGFCAALLTGDPEAVRSTGLDAEDLALLEGVDPIAVAADPRGERRLQIVGNATSEFRLTLAAASERPDASELLDHFPRAAEFHTAMADAGRLPLAFAEFARRWAESKGARGVLAVLELEAAMARLRRRAPEDDGVLAPGALRLASCASVVRLTLGTLAFAGRLQTALDADEPYTGGSGIESTGTETVLLRADRSGSRHALARVTPELLRPPIDELMARAETALSAPEREAFARAHGAEPASLERFLDGFVEEGTLRRGA